MTQPLTSLTAKEGDICTTPAGEFRVARPERTYCSECAHHGVSQDEDDPCSGVGCGGTYGTAGFILLTEINYITYRLTK